jgi:hypothetical protein
MNGRRGWSSLLLRFWGVLGSVLTVVGLAGLSDDVAQWVEWIDAASTRVVSLLGDPEVVALAEWAVGAAEFLNQWWIRIGLIIVGVLLIFWPARRFWRFRHRLGFLWRRVLAEQVWISRDAAIKVIKESDWGRLKEPTVVSTEDPFAFLPGFGKKKVVYGLSDTAKALLKYDGFIEKTLRSFCQQNPTACRCQDHKAQVDEAILMHFLETAADQLLTEFGDVPAFKVEVEK